MQLCVIDTKPHREFAAEQYNMLIQVGSACVGLSAGQGE